jgi:galactokinase
MHVQKKVDPEKLVNRFKLLFGKEPVLYRAPGRVNIIGEHTDYNDGFVMPMNTAVYAWVAASPRIEPLLRVHSVLFDQTIEFALDSIEPGGAPAWAEYAKGVASTLQDEGFELTGADLLIDGEIPLGGGLSSSASLEAVIAVALLGCSGLEADPMKVALMCQRAEHEFAGVPCGIMDQAVICACPEDHAIRLDCRSLEIKPILLPADLCLLVVDSGVKHQLSDGGYRQRRFECDFAIDLLRKREPGVASYRDVSLQMLDVHQAELGELPFRRARHAVTETLRVQEAESAMAGGKLQELGEILNASHASLRDDFMVSCNELDFLQQTAVQTLGVYGSRMVGGGFGGCTISLVDPAMLDEVRGRIVAAYAEYSGQAPWSHRVKSASPAGLA